ncbi:helix-turn-helix domain-containing protein [Pseudobutyrivibrio ruminis]|uniref:helix-turn-helix domain-containing protein n=1 Tax=Pseudobutyrivibrio ruminis TaxID=46206 RepID=UPI0004127903|nr:helix-turn-helix transcriptional regulator [Pseudobutyrivibrio ruminis]
MDIKAFGQFLRWMRKKMNMSQLDLALTVGCTMPTISKIENGQEYIGKRLFDKLNELFEGFGFSYDELSMERLFKFKQARAELLKAIKRGRIEDIENKIDKLQEYMDIKEGISENTIRNFEKKRNSNDIYEWEHINYDSDYEVDKQYFVFAHLIRSRQNGMTLEVFLDEAIGIFELRRKIPDYKDIPDVRLSNIEYELFFIIAKTHLAMGDDNTAELIFKGLLYNKCYLDSPKVRERYLEISVVMASLLLDRRDFKGAYECLSFIFGEYISNFDTQVIYSALKVQHDYCKKNNDDDGVRIIDRFFISTDNLMTHMLKIYRLNQMG